MVLVAVYALFMCEKGKALHFLFAKEIRELSKHVKIKQEVGSKSDISRLVNYQSLQ